MKKRLFLGAMVILTICFSACNGDNGNTDKKAGETLKTTDKAENNTTDTFKENTENDKKGNNEKIDLSNYPETAAEDFDYKETEEGIVIRGYMGDDDIVVIPAKINGKDVTIIGAEAFELRSFKAFVIGKNVREIRESAFAFSNIDDIYINENLEKMGDTAFAYSSISNIKLPDSLKEIGDCALSGTNIVEIDIPDSVEIIDEGVFSSCSKLERVKIGENSSLSRIGSRQFAFCKNIKEVEIPATVTDIGDEMFFDANNAVIITPAGSYAEQYCKENNIQVRQK